MEWHNKSYYMFAKIMQVPASDTFQKRVGIVGLPHIYQEIQITNDAWFFVGFWVGNEGVSNILDG